LGIDRTTDYGPDAPSPAAGLTVLAKYRIARQAIGGAATTERYNALGQLVARESSGFNGTTVLEELGYDQRNRLPIRSRPHLPGDTSEGLIQLGYDNLDRLTTETYPNGSVVNHDDYDACAALGGAMGTTTASKLSSMSPPVPHQSQPRVTRNYYNAASRTRRPHHDYRRAA
jgi:hypothetical protein